MIKKLFAFFKKLFGMIKIGNTEVQYIKVGANNVPGAIKVEQAVVWPTSFFYTLVFYSRSYSSSTNKVHATGSDYCEFSCKYSKYRTADSGLVEETIVVAVPSTIYFKSVNNKLYYDYDNYKATVVSSGVTNVQLSYGGLSIMTTFDFAGNSESTRTTITPVVPSVETVAASGGTISYTGGVYTTNKTYSSGYNQFISSGKTDFYPAYHSKDSSFGAYAMNNEIHIPSLQTRILEQGTYTFTSLTYNGTYITFTVGQQANTRTSTSTYTAYNTSGDTEMPGTYRIGGDSDGSFGFYVKTTRKDYYTSNASSQTTYDLSNTSWTATTENDGHNIVQNINRAGDGKSMTVNYRANVEDYAVDCYINFTTGYSSTFLFRLAQSAATVYYTLTNPSASYSNSGNTVHSNGNDYVVFSCRYNKVRATDDRVISYTTVTATPSCTYFKATGTKLYYDYNNYKATAVASGNKPVGLTYNGLSTTGSLSFAGNSYTESSSISPVVITGVGSSSANPAPASGGTLTYTGGVITNYRDWTSGYKETVGTAKAAFNSATNSKDSRFVGVVIPAQNIINIPSLSTATTDAGYYAFTSQSYNGETTSFNVYQENNYQTYIGHSYAFYDGANNTPLPDPCTVSSSAGTITFYVKHTTTRNYKSGASGSTTNTVRSTDMTVSYQSAYGGGIITNTGISSAFNIVLIYSQNTTQNQRMDIVTASNIDGAGSASFALAQAASEVDVYVLTTTVSSLTVGSAASSVTFGITSTKNGAPYQPAVAINPNNIGGTINVAGSGPYTATLQYTENLSYTDPRTATVNVSQTGGLSKSISVTQQAAGDDPFYGIKIKETSGKWAIGTLKTSETTIQGVGKLDVACIMVVCKEPITTNTTIDISYIAIQQMTTTSNYYSVSQTINAGSTITMTPYGGQSHTYYGAWLTFVYDGTTKTFSPYPGTQINMIGTVTIS